jgi:hypothetical protein
VTWADVRYPPDDGPRVLGLDAAHDVFRRWLGDDYDLDALDAAAATAVAAQLGGDPLWLLLVSGSGNAKTETVQSAVGAGALVVSTISGEAALLSGTPKPQRAAGATGGCCARSATKGCSW